MRIVRGIGYVIDRLGLWLQEIGSRLRYWQRAMTAREEDDLP